MIQKPLSQLTDEELLQEAKRQKSAAIMNALIIGFLVGIIFYSVVKNTWGLVTLIPLYMVYRMINNSKSDPKELDDLLKKRNLK